MIFAKISPAAVAVRQDGPFSSSTVSAEYMAASARSYALGADDVRFEVQFGNVTLGEDGQVTDFQGVTSNSVELSAAELANWGTDDSVVLKAIASKLGTSVVSTVSGNVGRRF